MTGQTGQSDEIHSPEACARSVVSGARKEKYVALDVMASSDRSVSDAFAERTLQIITDGALALMMSVGHRTGLFDIMSCMPASSAAQIAAAAGLSERYVREWLGAMVTGRIVTYDRATETYMLPVEHAACVLVRMPHGGCDQRLPFGIG